MIEVTRLNGHSFVVNSDLIKLAEAIPDTTITLITGDKIVVRETCADVLARTLQYRAQVMHAAWPSGGTALSAHSAMQTEVQSS